MAGRATKEKSDKIGSIIKEKKEKTGDQSIGFGY